MTERELQDALTSLLLDLVDMQDDDDPDGHLGDHLPGIEGAATFDQRGLLSGNKGLVVSFEDGSEFQINIVRSR